MKNLFKKIWFFLLSILGVFSFAGGILTSCSLADVNTCEIVTTDNKNSGGHETLTNLHISTTLMFESMEGRSTNFDKANWTIKSEDPSESPAYYLQFDGSLNADGSYTFLDAHYWNIRWNHVPTHNVTKKYDISAIDTNNSSHTASFLLVLQIYSNPTPIPELHITLGCGSPHLQPLWDNLYPSTVVNGQLFGVSSGTLTYSLSGDGEPFVTQSQTGNDLTIAISDPTYNATKTVTVTASYGNAQPKDIEITLIPKPTPYINLSADNLFLSDTITTSIVTANIEYGDPSIPMQFSYSSPAGIDYQNFLTITPQTNGIKIDLTTQPANTFVFQITAAYPDATNASIYITIVGSTPPVVWYTMTSTPSFLQETNDVSTITITSHGSDAAPMVGIDSALGSYVNLGSLSHPSANTYTTTLTLIQPVTTDTTVLVSAFLPASPNDSRAYTEVTLIPPLPVYIALAATSSYLVPQIAPSTTISATFTNAPTGSIATMAASGDGASYCQFNDNGNNTATLTLAQQPKDVKVVTITATYLSAVSTINITLLPDQSTPIPQFETYSPAMNVGQKQDLKAFYTDSNGTKHYLTLGVEGNNKTTCWTFNDATGELEYIKSSTQDIILTVTAKNGNYETIIYISLKYWNPIPQFAQYTPFMNPTDSQTLTATYKMPDGTSANATISVTGASSSNWTFNSTTGALTYTTPVASNVTLKATAKYSNSDPNANQTDIYIVLLAPGAQPPVFDPYSPFMRQGDSQTLVAKSGTNNCTITVSGTGQNTNWTFNNGTGVLTYTLATSADITLTVEAEYNGMKTTVYIALASNQKLPVTTDFFTFSGTTITGYASNFLSACGSDANMKQYLKTKAGSTAINILDLSNQTISGNYEALSSQKPGNENIAEFYKQVYKIDLTGAKFDQYDRSSTKDIFMGCYTFSAYGLSTKLDDFENVESLVFDNVDFRTNSFYGYDSVNSVHTAYGLFANMNFASLKELTISNSDFTVLPQQARTHTANISITTAEGTFANCDFPALTKLDINNNKFASTNMDSDGSTGYEVGRDVDVNTFDSTFSGCTFDELTGDGFLLNANNIFVATNMTAGHVSVCNSSFASCSFPQLDELTLDDIVFAVPSTIKNYHYPDDANIYTASNMFGSCSFDSLQTLRINATFAASDTTYGDHDGNSKWAYNTFASCYLPVIIDIYVSDASHQPTNDYPWANTFDECYVHDDDDPDQITIHGYSDVPSWWNSGWLSWYMEPDWSDS